MPAKAIKGNLVRVEVATAFVTAIAAHQPTAVTKTYPAVATFPGGHGLAVGMGVVLVVGSGMAQLNGQATRISVLAANDATLQDIDATIYSDWVTAAGNTVLVAQTWSLLGESIAYRFGTGAAQVLEDGRLHLAAPATEKGADPVENAEFDLRGVTYYEGALEFVRQAARRGTSVLIRITHPDGATRHMYGEPSKPGEDVSFGALGTAGFTLAPKGVITVGAPLA
jgi:hypothetical protein